jgi:hypothetical protein
VPDEDWSEWLDGLVATAGPAGPTVLTGPNTDQAALHGTLARSRDLGVPLLSVRQREPRADEGPDVLQGWSRAVGGGRGPSGVGDAPARQRDDVQP